MRNIRSYLILGVAVMHLTACQTTGSNDSNSEGAKINAAIEKATQDASKNGYNSASLAVLEKQYQKNSADPAIALPYATALRHSGQLNRAAMILTPFANTETAASGVYTEMSMIQLSLGDHDSAEKYAQKAVLQDSADYQAYQNLGIALDAKGMHAEAERAFRKGLENWKGDPTIIMNNLALNLATQGFVDEAIEILERAKALSPDRIEIERNLRIVRTLNER